MQRHYQTLLLIAINRLPNKKRPWQSGNSRPSRSFFILNCISCFHMIFVISLAESFALKLDKSFCPEISPLLKLYVVIYILYSLDFIFHIFSMHFPYIPRYSYFYCSFCRHFIDNWEQKIWHYCSDKCNALSIIFLSRVELEFHSKATRFIYDTFITGMFSFSN